MWLFLSKLIGRRPLVLDLLVLLLLGTVAGIGLNATYNQGEGVFKAKQAEAVDMSWVPTVGTAVGNVESVATGRIAGWALDPTNVGQSIMVRLYVKRTGDSAMVFVNQFMADVSRPELVSLLGLPQTAGADKHGFDIPGSAIAPSLQTGDTVFVYAVAINGWNPLIGGEGGVVVGSPDVITPARTLFVPRSAAPTGGTGGGFAPTSGGGTTGGTSSLPTFGPFVPLFHSNDGGALCHAGTLEMPGCAQRLQACGTSARSPRTGGACDVNRYAVCTAAGIKAVPDGMTAAQACDVQIYSDPKCISDPNSCRAECVIPGVPHPDYCEDIKNGTGYPTNIEIRGGIMEAQNIKCDVSNLPAYEQCNDGISCGHKSSVDKSMWNRTEGRAAECCSGRAEQVGDRTSCSGINCVGIWHCIDE